MKTIAMMPVRNEEWVLHTTIPSLKRSVDVIVAADQHSTDNTRDILESYNVEVIDNDLEGHSNQVRWLLLDYIRQQHGQDNLILCVDADEIFPPYLFKKTKEKLMEQMTPGAVVSSPWVQIWRSIWKYRDDNSVWNPKTNKKPFMFLDDGSVDYRRERVINDHTSRVPTKGTKKQTEIKIPLLHLQFACWDRAQVKQAWYKCCELLEGSSAQSINQKYAHSKDESGIRYSDVPEVWYKDVPISSDIEKCDVENTWYFQQIKKWFEECGVDKFKPLDIWNVPQIKALAQEV